MADAPRVLLQGGYTNAGRVFRVGDTVRRPWRPTSPATNALLDHLERVGFDGAPRFLGVDDRGREILSFVPGEAVLEPVADWALTRRRAGQRRGAAPPLPRRGGVVRRVRGMPGRYAVPAAFRGGIVCHNDPNLDNVVFAGGRAVALVDFDLASPGCAAWDVGVRRPAMGAPARRARHAGAPARPRARPPAPFPRRLRHGQRETARGSSTPWSTRTTGATGSFARRSPPVMSRSAGCGTAAAPPRAARTRAGWRPTAMRCGAPRCDARLALKPRCRPTGPLDNACSSRNALLADEHAALK